MGVGKKIYNTEKKELRIKLAFGIKPIYFVLKNLCRYMAMLSRGLQLYEPQFIGKSVCLFGI